MKTAKLRVCMSCEWVFKALVDDTGCPKCRWPSYGARWVYGNKAYQYEKTQEHWLERKMTTYERSLMREIRGEA